MCFSFYGETLRIGATGKGLNSCDFGRSFKLLQKNKFRKRERAEISALSLFVGCACGRLCNGCAKTAARKVKLKRRGETAVGANSFAPTAVFWVVAKACKNAQKRTNTCKHTRKNAYNGTTMQAERCRRKKHLRRVAGLFKKCPTFFAVKNCRANEFHYYRFTAGQTFAWQTAMPFGAKSAELHRFHHYLFLRGQEIREAR